MQLMNFAFGADVVLANSGYGTTMLFDNSVTLPNSKIFAAIISIIFAIGLVIYMKKSKFCLLYTFPSARDPKTSRMPSSA